MKLSGWQNIIKALMLVMTVPGNFYCQDQMTRLSLEYRYFSSRDETEKNFLSLAIANEYLNSGDYDEARRLLENVRQDSTGSAFRNFLTAKTFFAAENHREAVSYFNRIDTSTLPKQFVPEYVLLKTVCYNHLFLKDSTLMVISGYYLANGKDTAGMAAEINSFHEPRLFNLRKARRRSSIIPGTGLMYIGERQKGATSLLLNIAFAGYTAYSIYTRYYFTAVLTGAAQLMRFYGGGKKAAVRIGHSKNQSALSKYFLSIDSYCGKKILGL
jgi:hypothetical protein